MVTQVQPHIVYLERLYDETLSAAGLPRRTYETIERGTLCPQYDEHELSAFEDYFGHISHATSHLNDVYDDYREKHDERLWEPVNRKHKPALIWTLASVAVGEQHLASADGTIKGGLNEDISELRVVRQMLKSRISVQLVVLSRYGLIKGHFDDSMVRVLDDGSSRPPIRYNTVEPERGKGPKVHSSVRAVKKAGRLSLHPIFGTS